MPCWGWAACLVLPIRSICRTSRRSSRRYSGGDRQVRKVRVSFIRDGGCKTDAGMLRSSSSPYARRYIRGLLPSQRLCRHSQHLVQSSSIDVCTGNTADRATSRGLLHDPETYSDPLTFNPSRFVSSDTHTPERDPTDFCFGFGRRCVIISLTRPAFFSHTLTSLVQRMSRQRARPICRLSHLCHCSDRTGHPQGEGRQRHRD
jgi:hypothetical protein